MSERTPYQRLTDRRRLRAARLAASLADQVTVIRRALDKGQIPDSQVADTAARLDQALAELAALAELHEEEAAES